MAFKRQGKARKAKENKIEVIKEVVKEVKPIEDKKVIASMEEKIVCPKCKKIIGAKIGQIYQILDQRLVSLKGMVCPNCKGELK